MVDNSQLRFFRLAYVRLLNALPAGPHSEMQLDSGLARFKFLSGSASGYRIVNIRSLIRPLHMIPEHPDDGTKDSNMKWFLNNRIDHGIWDLVYGEQEEVLV